MKHVVTGRWKRGFLLAGITALLWGGLPIILKVLLQRMDAYTLTWYRFLAASVILGLFLWRKKGLPPLLTLGGKSWLLLTVAALGLCGNYVMYLFGLERVAPETAQMVIQLAPMFLLLGGLVFFGESFNFKQWLGLLFLALGLLFFFNERIHDLTGQDSAYYTGILLIVISAVIWAAYGLAQKRLLVSLSSVEILFLLYSASVILLFPAVQLSQIMDLNRLDALLLAFCCINTVIAYGSFAEAMVHWEASRVSAVLATTPLITLAAVWWLAGVAPEWIVAEDLNTLALVGAFLVVAGSMLAALGRSAD